MVIGDGAGGGARRVLTAGVVFAAITCGLFFNLLPGLATHVYSDLGDPLLNAATLVWNARHPPLTDAWWNIPMFAPYAGVTAWTEHLLGAYPLTTPVVWLTGNGILAHNLLLLCCFVLNGVCAFALAYELTGMFAPAFVGGLAFAFSPFQAVHVSHVQTLMGFGMPLTLFGLHRFLRDRRPASLGWAGVGWVSALLSNAYTMVFFSVFVGLWCVWFLRRAAWSTRCRVFCVLLLGVVLVSPLLWGYRARLSAYGFVRSYTEMRAQSADVASVVGVSHRSVLWAAHLPVHFGEGSLYPGIGILALAVIGVGVGMRRQGTPSPWSQRCLMASGLVLAVTAVRVWLGPDGWRIGPVPLPRLTPFRGVTVCVALTLVALGASRRMRAAWAAADPVPFYAAAAVIMWFVALGPQPAFLGDRALAYGPYRLLLEMPGLEGLRVPARAWVPATLALAVCASAGAAVLLPRVAWPRLVACALAVVVLGDGWFYDWTRPAPTARFQGVIPAGALVLDVPIGGGLEDMDAGYRAVVGGYRSIDGYSGYFPLHYGAVVESVRRHDPRVVEAYRALDDLYVIVRSSAGAADRTWFEAQPGAVSLWSADGWRLFRLPRTSTASSPIPIALPTSGTDPFGERLVTPR